MFKLSIVFDSLDLAGDKAWYLLLHALTVGIDGLAGTIEASFVKELCNDRDRLVAP